MYCLTEIPKVEVTPTIVTEKQGRDVRALCRASGSPAPQIEWNFDILHTLHEVSCPTSLLLV